MLFICSALKHTSAFYLFILDVLFSSCMCNIIALKQRWKTESVGAELKAYVQGLLFRILTFCSNSELLIIKMSFEFLQFNIGNAHLARYFQNNAVLAYCFGFFLHKTWWVFWSLKLNILRGVSVKSDLVCMGKDFVTFCYEVK